MSQCSASRRKITDGSAASTSGTPSRRHRASHGPRQMVNEAGKWFDIEVPTCSLDADGAAQPEQAAGLEEDNEQDGEAQRDGIARHRPAPPVTARKASGVRTLIRWATGRTPDRAGYDQDAAPSIEEPRRGRGAARHRQGLRAERRMVPISRSAALRTSTWSASARPARSRRKRRRGSPARQEVLQPRGVAVAIEARST